MRTLLAALVLSSLRAQTLSPEFDALSKIRARMNFNLAHQPNYTCVETIERAARARTSNKLKIIDTLRLEVALVDGKEMFAWPGSKKFDDSDITKLVTSGAIGNGNFGTHAKALFGTDFASFHYLGEEDFAGRRAIRFDYTVPQFLSGYRIRVSQASAIVGYHGWFYANPQTFEVERLVVIADNIPPELLLSATEDKIDYAMTRIGEADFLLPSESELTMVGAEGGEEHNRVRFSSCRQFSGESVITFADAPSGKPDVAPVPTREFDLPAGLEIELELSRDLDLPDAAIGDPVYASVRNTVKHKGQILLPKGATANGRIVRLEESESYWILGVAFPEIEAPGILARMKGSLTRTLGVQPLLPRRGSIKETPNPGEGLIQVNTMQQRRLARGCIMFWST